MTVLAITTYKKFKKKHRTLFQNSDKRARFDKLLTHVVKPLYTSEEITSLRVAWQSLMLCQ